MYIGRNDKINEVTEMNLYCNNNICPICNSEMKIILSKPYLNDVNIQMERKICLNNCYFVSRNVADKGIENFETFIIFSHTITIEPNISKEEKKIKYKEIEHEINEWKKDDKYLLELLSFNTKELFISKKNT